MGRIEDIFAGLRRDGRTGLIPFVCGHHPRPGETARLLSALDEAGAAVIEVGFPFSDPIADGPVIAEAMRQALAAGSTPTSLMAEVAGARQGLRAAIVAMVSVSIITRAGEPGVFMGRLRDAGFDGVIVPDCPFEEAAPVGQAAAAAGLAMPLLVGPATVPDRTREIAQHATGFVYVMARVGVTGDRSPGGDGSRLVHEVRKHTSLPVAAGFGIATPEQVRAVTTHADAAIVGTALVRRIGDAPDPVSGAAALARELMAGLAVRQPSPGRAAGDEAPSASDPGRPMPAGAGEGPRA